MERQLLSKIIAVGAVSLGLTLGLSGVGAADPIQPGPTSKGPFTQTGEPTGKSACQAASIKTGKYNGCFEYPPASGKWYFTPSS